MPKYYKVQDGCKKCQRKGVFTLSENDADTWGCPYGTPTCSGELVGVGFIAKHQNTLLKGGALLLVLFLIGSLFIDGDKDKLEKELTNIQNEASDFNVEVRKVPQNYGADDPYKAKWVSNLNKKSKRLQAQLKPIRQDLEKLDEFDTAVEGIEKRAAAVVIPDFAPVKPLKKYSELKAKGNKLRYKFESIKGKADRGDYRDISVQAGRSIRDLKEDLLSLKHKSKAVGVDGQAINPEKAKENYLASISTLRVAIKAARLDEKQRRARLAEEERLRRLAEAEAERRRSQQQRIEAWNKATPKISIRASTPLTTSLIEPLIRSFLEFKSATQCKTLTSPYGHSVTRFYTPQFTVEISDGNDLTLPPLHIEVRSRATSKENSRIIALDAMVAVGGAASLDALNAGDLEKVIAGEITNWSDLGGVNAPIQLIVPAASSKDASIISDDIAALIERNRNDVASDDVANDCLTNQSSLGICAFHNSPGANRIGVRASTKSPIFQPTPSSISSENYRYTKRVYVDIPANTGSEVESFLSFVESATGQQKVSECGFVDLRIDLVSKPLDPFALPIIAKAFNVNVSDIDSAYRLNTNFRFATNSSNLDTKARADIERVQQTLNIHLNSNKKALVVGFTDSDGTDESNHILSGKRSKQVFSKLLPQVRKKEGIKSAAEGENHPISDNDTEVGKSQNRRVEVWIVEIN